MRRSALDEGKQWLSQAAEDLHWAKNLAEDGIPSQVYTQDAATGAVALSGEAVEWVRGLLEQSQESTLGP